MSDSASRLWVDFLASKSPEAQLAVGKTYSAWQFGHGVEQGNHLVACVLDGPKRATAGALWTYEAEGEAVPVPGDHSVILDGEGVARCVIRTTRVDVVPFDEVDAAFAYDEGEGDRSLDYWREAHWTYFVRELTELGLEAALDMPVVWAEALLTQEAGDVTLVTVRWTGSGTRPLVRVLLPFMWGAVACGIVRCCCCDPYHCPEVEVSKRTLLLVLVMFVVLGAAGLPGCGGKASTSSEPSTAANGLVIEDEVVGDGPAAKSGDTVTVHYTGWLTDGTKFDSSLDRNEPFTFALGAQQVIAGWDQGVAGMKVGGKRKLTIPPELGYGAQANGPIPANATLLFEVELLQINGQ